METADPNLPTARTPEQASGQQSDEASTEETGPNQNAASLDDQARQQVDDTPAEDEDPNSQADAPTSSLPTDPSSSTPNHSAAGSGSMRGQVAVQWAQTTVAGIASLAALGALIYTAQATQATRDTVEITEQGQVTDRFTSAVGQLGDDKLDVRLGGIYALERIAQDSPRDHGAIMEVLSAFIRENSPAPRQLTMSQRPSVPKIADGRGDMPEPKRRPATDVQAAATVIGRRDVKNDPEGFVLDLRAVDLRGAHLEGANFRATQLDGADFSGARMDRAILQQVTMQASEIDAPFEDPKTKTSVNFSAAVLEGADLSGSTLAYANFSNAWLADVKMRDAFLWGADFRNSVLASSDLSCSRPLSADFGGARLGSGLKVRGTNFEGANLKGVEESWFKAPKISVKDMEFCESLTQSQRR
ncbi:pentapeptide repeat-containing protein [Streptomyces fungicidicus]|uniref:pentapeptide repeat-containing protein n=1 Tax=Streptomyces fungicidicus TaxID=68203 RepID=UPI003D750238